VGTWTGGSSDWKVLNGVLLNDGTNETNSGSPTIVAPCQLGNTSNYAVETTIQVLNSGYLTCFGISVRGTTVATDTGWQGYIAGIGDCGAVSGAFLGGPTIYNGQTGSEQANFNPGTIKHTYRVEANGNTIKLYIDGASWLTLTDNRFLNGSQVGLWCQGEQLQVTSFKVVAL
jgi:hypothetical protein